jgi:pSer/pThr/pTyr-binding forkhead associated (FHA) protein
MNEEYLIFGLRIAASLFLLSFFGAIGFMLWRDYRMAESSIEGRTRRRGRLVVTQNNGNSIYEIGHTFPLMPHTTIGRAHSNTIQLDDVVVSNEHALIEWRDGQWWLEDLNSSNGTFLNTHRVEDSMIVSTADEINFGNIRFRIELD